MYFGLIVTLLCGGAALSRWAVSAPALTTRLERAGGIALIMGFALLGFALPITHHFTHVDARDAAGGSGYSLVAQDLAAGIAGAFQNADAGSQPLIQSGPGKVNAAAGGPAAGDRWSAPQEN